MRYNKRTAMTNHGMNKLLCRTYIRKLFCYIIFLPALFSCTCLTAYMYVNRNKVISIDNAWGIFCRKYSQTFDDQLDFQLYLCFFNIQTFPSCTYKRTLIDEIVPAKSNQLVLTCASANHILHTCLFLTTINTLCELESVIRFVTNNRIESFDDWSVLFNNIETKRDLLLKRFI